MVAVQKTVGGYQFEGEWEDVVDRGREVTSTLKETDADREELEEWEEWRPRREESLDNEVREKTVEKACMPENQAEQEGETVRTQSEQAVQELGAAAQEASEGRARRAFDRVRAFTRRTLLLADTITRKGLRRVERVVYSDVVTRTNPYYFDSGMVSASIERKTGVLRGADGGYRLVVRVNDGDVFKQFENQFDAAI